MFLSILPNENAFLAGGSIDFCSQSFNCSYLCSSVLSTGATTTQLSSLATNYLATTFGQSATNLGL